MITCMMYYLSGNRDSAGVLEWRKKLVNKSDGKDGCGMALQGVFLQNQVIAWRPPIHQ